MREYVGKYLRGVLLIRVTKNKLRDSWINIRLNPLWALDNVSFYEI